MSEEEKQLLGSVLMNRFNSTKSVKEMKLLIGISSKSGLTDLAVQMEADMNYEVNRNDWEKRVTAISIVVQQIMNLEDRNKDLSVKERSAKMKAVYKDLVVDRLLVSPTEVAAMELYHYMQGRLLHFPADWVYEMDEKSMKAFAEENKNLAEYRN